MFITYLSRCDFITLHAHLVIASKIGSYSSLAAVRRRQGKLVPSYVKGSFTNASLAVVGTSAMNFDRQNETMHAINTGLT